MTTELKGLERIIGSMQTPIRKFAERIQELGGSNALGLILYGAIGVGRFDPATQTARSVVILQRVDLAMLRQLAKEGTTLGKARIAAPLIMTPEYIAESLDSFPLEFIEIQQSRLCLFGTDYFEGLTFQEHDVRLQCEREFKTVLIGMRQGLLATAGREKLFSGIEAEVAERVIRTLRGLLWLHNHDESLPGSQVISEVEKHVGQSLTGLRGAMDPKGSHEWEEFCALYAEVDALRKFIDAW